MSGDAIEASFVEEKGAALAIREESAPVGIFQVDDPVDVIERATRVADALKRVVVAKKLVSNIQGKEYPLAEAWTTLAAMLNLDVICEWTRRIEGGWEARVVVRRNGLDVGAAEAQCTHEERMWKSREDYALRSMAQTRATSKAIRAKLGFVMTLAGYNATPAEEIPADDEQPRPPAAPPAEDEHARGVKALMALCSKHKVDDEKRYAIAAHHFAKRSTKDLTVPQLRAFYKLIQDYIKERDNA